MRVKRDNLAYLEYDETNNILFYRVKQNMEIDVARINEMINDVAEFMGEKKHMAVIDFGGDLTSTTEARAFYAASDYIKKYRLADAFLVNSVSVRIVANFFIKVNKPEVSTRLFSNEEDALKWLGKSVLLQEV